MTHLSLFSGIGGIDLAAEWAGFKTVAFCENDPFCQKVLAKHWPGVPIYGDVSTLQASEHDGLIGVDLLSGGFPCQDVSAANANGQGISGSRSGLYSHVLRIACDIRPKFLLLENVAGLITGGGISTVLGDLSKMGFDTAWGSPQAFSVGAFDQRERVFIVAYPAGFRSDNLEQKIRDLYKDGMVNHPTTRGWNLSEFSASTNFPDQLRPVPQGGILRMGDGVPGRMDRYRALGNAVKPAQVLPILLAIADELNPASPTPSIGVG